MDAVHAARAPRLDLLQRPHKHLVEAEAVGAVLLHHVVGVDDVAAALGHLVRPRLDPHGRVGLQHEAVALLLDLRFGHAHALDAPPVGRAPDRLVHLVLLLRLRHVVAGDKRARFVAEGRVLDFAEDHALVNELLERLLRRHHADVVEHLVPEPGVQQVEHRVLGPADVQVHRHPVVLFRRIDELVRVFWVEVAEVVPARSGPVGHRVGFAARRASVGRDGFHPLGYRRERAFGRTRRPVVAGFGQPHRKLRLGQDNRAGAVFGEDDGERLAPEALAGEEPVAQLVVDLAASRARRFQPREHRGLGLGVAQPVERDVLRRRVHVRPVAHERLGGKVAAGHDLHDRQIERLGEGVVAHIVARHGHNRAGAVGGEHVIGHPDRHGRAVGGVDGVGPGEHARLLLALGAFEVGLPGRLVHIVLHGGPLRVGGDAGHQRMLRGQHHVRRAEERVGAGGEDGDGGVVAVHGKVDLRALAPSDPVALHLQRRGRPVEAVEVFEEPVGVFGDPQHPLLEVAALHREAAALGLAVDHLLVGEHRAEAFAPVHRHLVEVGEAALVELQEDPLRPAVVVGVGGGQLAGPVVREAEGLKLLAEALDVALRRDGRVGAGLDGVLLRREAEGVPSHRVEDVEAAHPLVAGEDVGSGVALRVAHVQPRARRVRKHVEHIVGRLRRVEAVADRGRAERLVIGPEALPAGFDVVVRVGGHGERRRAKS